MARTTLDIDPSVRDELRRLSSEQNKSMGQVASELLAAALADPGSAAAPAPTFAWASADLGVARVDIEDKEALRRALEDR